MIDTEMYKKGFVKNLEPKYKLLWTYLLLECDHCGLWNVELDVAEIRLGFSYDEAEVFEVFSGKIIKLKNDKWFLPSFIEFQYGELNPSNRVHNSVINNLKNKGVRYPLQGVLQGAKDKDKDIDKDKGKDKDKEKEKENFTKEKEKVDQSGLDIFATDKPPEEPDIMHGGFEAFRESVKYFLEKEQSYIWEKYDDKNSKELYSKIHQLLQRNKLPIDDGSLYDSFRHIYQLAEQDEFHSKNLNLGYLDKQFNRVIRGGKNKNGKKSLSESLKEVDEWTL